MTGITKYKELALAIEWRHLNDYIDFMDLQVKQIRSIY